ncbi:hypothetical protein, partial [Bacteroides fragilis]|uniref:hypothetical protein n=1 Tax=Bacteroides fragilis TaxID=817 RepID=UPI0032EACDEA
NNRYTDTGITIRLASPASGLHPIGDQTDRSFSVHSCRKYQKTGNLLTEPSGVTLKVPDRQRTR